MGYLRNRIEKQVLSPIDYTQTNDWKCTKCKKYVSNQTDEQMYSRMVTCPYCGYGMVKVKEVSVSSQNSNMDKWIPLKLPAPFSGITHTTPKAILYGGTCIVIGSLIGYKKKKVKGAIIGGGLGLIAGILAIPATIVLSGGY